MCADLDLPLSAPETWWKHDFIKTFVLHLQVSHQRGNKRKTVYAQTQRYCGSSEPAIISESCISQKPHFQGRASADISLFLSLCGSNVPSLSLSLPRSPLCCLSAPLLPSSAPSLHPQGQWPRLIAVSIAHGFLSPLWPDFCSKPACSWVWNILLFPKTSGQSHEEREGMGNLKRYCRNIIASFYILSSMI